jgi:DGQHR domain-containing protein
MKKNSLRNKNNKPSKKQELTPEKLERRAKRAFKNKIIKIFTEAGFKHIPTNDKEMHIGHRTVEVDSLFIYENIWLFCEDTIKSTNIRDHIRTKNEAFGQIKSCFNDFLSEILKLFPDLSEDIRKYDAKRIKTFALYISKEEVPLSDDEYKVFPELSFVQPKTFNYFLWITQCIKRSAKNEIFRFLNLKNADIGQISSSSEAACITAPIIYPKSFTGLNNDVRIVSFMMSAEDLLHTCYVLRKDNWSDSIWLYQRLIEKKKIKSIRDFIEKKGEAFYNNIIVGLPDNVRFCDERGDYKAINEIGDLEGNCTLTFPKEMNSICVIDGQHRIFAHYESGTDSKQEQIISKLRKQLHLLVTGLVFPTEMSNEERARIQSEIFVDINSNAKLVPQSVLLQIKRIQNPIAAESLAQFVVEKLNKQGVFQNMLQISSLDNGKIKTASIVRFALRYLVTATPLEGKQSLFNYWNGHKDDFFKLKSDAIDEYVEFCVSILRGYFGAIKKNLKEQWENNSSKLLSVIAINGFIIALNRQLSINGVHDFEYYDNIFNSWKYDFSSESFPYTSSQYRKFSTRILEDAFKINPDILETI